MWQPLDEAVTSHVIELEKTRQLVYKKVEDHYRANYKTLVNMCTRTFDNVHDAEETVQEAYTKACEYWKTVEPDSFDQWFSGILRNCISNTWNGITKNGMSVSYNDSKDGRAEEFSPLLAFSKTFIQTQIEKEFDKHQVILKLSIYHDMDTNEIAKIVPHKSRYIATVIFNFTRKLREMNDENMRK